MVVLPNSFINCFKTGATNKEKGTWWYCQTPLLIASIRRIAIDTHLDPVIFQQLLPFLLG